MSGEGGRVHPALILKTFYVIFLVLEDIFEYFCLFFGEAKNKLFQLVTVHHQNELKTHADLTPLLRTPGIVKGNKSLKISHLVWFQ